MTIKFIQLLCFLALFPTLLCLAFTRLCEAWWEAIEEELRPPDQSYWHQRYIERLVSKGAMTYREAKDVLKAGMGEYDYDDSPEDEADEELSYWSSNG